MGDPFLPLQGYKLVRVYNFNPLSLKHTLLSIEDIDENREIIIDTTRIEVKTFAFPVFSSLPCQVRTVELPARRDDTHTFYTAIMLTKYALIAVSVSQKIS
jgi:hypothetical protein